MHWNCESGQSGTVQVPDKNDVVLGGHNAGSSSAPFEQSVADPGRVDEFQLARTAEESSMLARRTSFLVFTKHAVEFTVAPDKLNFKKNEYTR